MPIVNGKYKNPGWVNGTRPPINGQNLNDISDTLERLDQGGSSGKRTARFVVGTSTSGWTAADCDYLCDGTNDNVEIQTALDALPAAGGEIVILDGTYQIASQISCQNKSIRLRRSGVVIWNFGSGGSLKLIFPSSVGAGRQEITGIWFQGGGQVTAQASWVSITGCKFYNCPLNLYSLSNADESYWVEGNEFRKTDSVSGSVLSVSVRGNCRIANNSFVSTATGSNATLLTIGHGGSTVFYSNTVTGTGGEHIQVWCSAVYGNTFSACGSIGADECRNFSSNRINGGKVSAGAINSSSDIGENAVVCGNTLINSGILVSGNSAVTGNSIQTPTEYGIKIFPGNPSDYSYGTPLVEGNLIMFESGSTTTGILIANWGSTGESVHSGAVVLGNKIINTTAPIDIQSKWTSCCVVNNFFNTGSITDAGTGNTKRDNGPQMSA